MMSKEEHKELALIAPTISSDGADYHVGYGRPPKQYQFKAGQSGNPKGRPKGSLNLNTIVESVARELGPTPNKFIAD